MNIQERIQMLDPGAILELIEIDLSPITKTDTATDHFYFHAGTNDLGGPVVWQGKTYSPYPVETEGFEASTKGTLPRPRLRAANVSGLLTAANLELGDLVGAKVIRRRTFAAYLDAVNFSAGNAGADPNQHLPDDVFYVERKVSSNNVMVEWELASAMDLEGVQLPARTIVANYCPWRYRSYQNGAMSYVGVQECTYTAGVYFTAQNASTSDPTKDVCAKTLQACKLRFGQGTVLPFGGFPAAKAYKL